MKVLQREHPGVVVHWDIEEKEPRMLWESSGQASTPFAGQLFRENDRLVWLRAFYATSCSSIGLLGEVGGHKPVMDTFRRFHGTCIHRFPTALVCGKCLFQGLAVGQVGQRLPR